MLKFALVKIRFNKKVDIKTILLKVLTKKSKLAKRKLRIKDQLFINDGKQIHFLDLKFNSRNFLLNPKYL